MPKWLDWIRNHSKRKRFEQFAQERRFKLNGPMGFSVDGLLVREFAYLLRYVTNGKHRAFDDFEKIANDFVAIDAAILTGMKRPMLREEEAHFTGHEGALRNQRNLRNIVRCITEYVHLAKEIGLPVNPAVH